MAIEKITIEKVKVGMYINKLDVGWFHHPFAKNSFIIWDEGDLSRLIKTETKYVYVDTEKGFDNTSGKNTQNNNNSLVKKWNLRGLTQVESEILKDKVPLYEEMKTARKTYYQTRKVIEDVFNSIKNGKDINWDKVFKCIDKMTESILRNKDAFINLSVIKHHDNYTFYHSLNVCCLCITLGRYLFLYRGDLAALGVGALLHDIGKIRIPSEILNKPGKLTEEEFSIIKKHPEYSLEILSAYSSLRWDSIHIGYEHHERFDGSGYPLGLKGFRINQFALIAAIADVYDAVTTDRPYRKALPLDQAMQLIFEGSERDFAAPYIMKFAQCMGAYPVGLIVELNNGEIGIVAAANHVDLERPKVLGIYDSTRQKLKKPKIIDLASEEYSEINIKRCFDNKTLNINAANLLLEEVMI